MSAPASRPFTAKKFARAAHLRESRAQKFLEDFELAGVVERRGELWAVTARGLALSKSLAIATTPRKTRARAA